MTFVTRSHVNGDEVGQSNSGLEPDCPVGVVQSLHEGRLQLREEGLEQRPGLLQQRGQGVQDGRLDAVAEPVAQDADERTGDVDHGRLQRLLARQVDDLAQSDGGLLLQLRRAVQNTFAEDGQNGLDAFGQAEAGQQEVGRGGPLRNVLHLHDGEADGLTDVSHVRHLWTDKMSTQRQLAALLPDERCLVLIEKNYFKMRKMQHDFIRDE